MRLSNKSKSKPKQPSAPLRLAFEAIGTWWQIETYDSVADVVGLERAIRERIAMFDKTYSRFRADSWITSLTTTTGPVTLPDDAGPLFALYARMYELTEGAVTPLIGQVLSDAGYDAAYSLQPGTMHTPPALDTVLHYDGDTNSLELLRPALLDFGAAGKGYLVDVICKLLEAHGVTGYCVDAGGDMRQRVLPGQPPVRVGMEHPDNPEQVVGVVRLGTQSLCGSAGNRRQWAGLHHIMDPRTLRPVQDVKAVWAVAPTALIADAMATCLFFTPGDVLQQHFDFSYTIIYSDNSYVVSPDFPGELFVAARVG